MAPISDQLKGTYMFAPLCSRSLSLQHPDLPLWRLLLCLDSLRYILIVWPSLRHGSSLRLCLQQLGPLLHVAMTAIQGLLPDFKGLSKKQTNQWTVAIIKAPSRVRRLQLVAAPSTRFSLMLNPRDRAAINQA